MRNNFNVDAAELLIFAPVDPYFNLYVNIPVTSDGAYLEEAYFVTTSLPEGLQVKGGRFKSNASRYNAQHPHAWDLPNCRWHIALFSDRKRWVGKTACS